MSKIKFTLGDWTVNPGTIWNEIVIGTHTLVAKAPQIEDAKLIAAAPKMYRALNKIAQMNICDSAFVAPNAAKKVLAEVEGEQCANR